MNVQTEQAIPPNTKQTSKRHWLALLGFLLLAALFYAPLLLGLRTFPDGDFTHHFLPFNLFQQAALQAGRLPLWNPYTYSGHPFLADIQAAVFYPVSNLLLLLTLPWTAAGERFYLLQIEAVVHIALAGYFVYLLVATLTGQRLAAFAAGCAFAFSGYLTGYPPLQVAVLRTAIWLPLLLYLLLQAMRQPLRWRWWISAAVAYTVAFLAGHPQTFLHLSYALAAWALFLLFSYQANTVRQLVGLGSFLLLALGLSAAQLLPSLEFSGLSVRANVDYAYVSGGFPLQDTWQLLLPGVLTQFSPLYIGVVGVGLALVGIGKWGRGGVKETRRQGDRKIGRQEVEMGRVQGHKLAPFPLPYSPTPSLFFTLLTLTALLLSYGDNGFLYPLAYRFAPGWQFFRGQERAAFLVALGLSVLIGMGMATLPTLRYGARRWLALLYAIIVSSGTFGFGLFWQLLGHSAISEGDYLLTAGVTVLLAMALVVLLLLPGWTQRRAIILIGLVIGNLFWANFTTNLDQFSPARKTILAPEMEALEKVVKEAGQQATGLPGRVYNEFRIYEDYGMRQGIEDVWGSSPLRLARYAALFDNFPLDRLWQLTGVTHLLTWRRELFEPSTLVAEFPQTADTTYLHRLVDPNPRAWLVHQVQPATDEKALTLLADHTFDVATIGLLPPETLATPLTLPTGKRIVQVDQLADGHLHVAVESETGGLLILSANWMPGWGVRNAECRMQNAECEADEFTNTGLQPLTVYRADLTLIGVVVPAGMVSFELVYWPQSVQFGLGISGGTLLLLLGLGGWRLWTRWGSAG